MLGQIVSSLEPVQYVEWPELITITVGLVTIIVSVAAIVFSKISSVSERVAVTEKQNEGDEQNFTVLFRKLETLEKDRMSDRIIYSDAINKLNVTLGKIETTLENNNDVIKELKEELNKRQK